MYTFTNTYMIARCFYPMGGYPAKLIQMRGPLGYSQLTSEEMCSHTPVRSHHHKRGCLEMVVLATAK